MAPTRWYTQTGVDIRRLRGDMRRREVIHGPQELMAYRAHTGGSYFFGAVRDTSHLVMPSMRADSPPVAQTELILKKDFCQNAVF